MSEPFLLDLDAQPVFETADACPFCGCQDQLVAAEIAESEDGPVWAVACPSSAWGPMSDGRRDGAVLEWNRRGAGHGRKS